MKTHKPELLAILAAKPEPPTVGQPETHADREWRRFLAVSRPWPDGRGLYDPGALRDAAGRAYWGLRFCPRSFNLHGPNARGAAFWRGVATE